MFDNESMLEATEANMVVLARRCDMSSSFGGCDASSGHMLHTLIFESRLFGHFILCTYFVCVCFSLSCKCFRC